MHARVLSFEGVSNIDETVTFIREKALPQVRQQKGYLGLSVSVDRSARSVNVMSSWDNEENLQASRDALAGLRAEGAGVAGTAEPALVHLEVLVNEVGDRPPAEGCRLRVVRLQADAARIDDEAAWMRSSVVPVLRSTPGFRAVRLMVDRSSGQGSVGTVWADDAALEGSEKVGQERRQEAAGRGVISFGDISRREIVFIDTV
jgi:heme-degrading monooxygenase HmoA